MLQRRDLAVEMVVKSCSGRSALKQCVLCNCKYRLAWHVVRMSGVAGASASIVSGERNTCAHVRVC